MVCQRIDDLEIVGIPPVPATHRPAGQAELWAVDDQTGVKV